MGAGSLRYNTQEPGTAMTGPHLDRTDDGRISGPAVIDPPPPAFPHRSCYVNFAEHLQNSWNPNIYYDGAPNMWSDSDWRSFFRMIAAFGFNVFEYWLVPTLMDVPALSGGAMYANFAERMRRITEIAHENLLRVKMLVAVNTIGPQWYFACPNDPADRQTIVKLWRHWLRQLPDTDIIGIFPGDPGGCNRNGCTHETFTALALELSGLIIAENPQATIEIGTWGTPFTGWGEDMISPRDWNGTFRQLTTQKLPPDAWAHIWNGTPQRAEAAMEHFLRRLPEFPEKTLVAINLGFSPDGDAVMGGDARPWAREIARIRPITTWDYSLAEGELVVYPHWRLPRMAARRREEKSAAPYSGGMTYTMSPKLNVLSLYAAGRLFQDPSLDPDELSRSFCSSVFGPEHAALGELFEAFEIIPGWGHYPRRKWSRPALRSAYQLMIDLLETADASRCALPLFPDPEAFRRDLLWFARAFHEMAGENPDREGIRREYWSRAFAIYDHIPMSVDERAEHAARKFSLAISQEARSGVTL